MVKTNQFISPQVTLVCRVHWRVDWAAPVLTELAQLSDRTDQSVLPRRVGVCAGCLRLFPTPYACIGQPEQLSFSVLTKSRQAEGFWQLFNGFGEHSAVNKSNEIEESSDTCGRRSFPQCLQYFHQGIRYHWHIFLFHLPIIKKKWHCHLWLSYYLNFSCFD